MARTLQGAGIYIAGLQGAHLVRSDAETLGECSQETCSAAFDTLSRAIREELAAQGSRLAAAEKVEHAIWLGSSGELDPLALEELVRQVAMHISVGPGMQVVLEKALPPTLWQPVFIVCVGKRDVRVLTLAFVGEPVTGDRPDRKRTPFLLRLLTSDLVEACRSALEGAPRSVVEVRYSAAHASVGLPLAHDHVHGLSEQLLSAVDGGDWEGLVAGAEGADNPEEEEEAYETI